MESSGISPNKTHKIIMTQNKTHGGKRPGSGRPKGTKKQEKVVTKSISMYPKQWKKLDDNFGKKHRGIVFRSFADALPEKKS